MSYPLMLILHLLAAIFFIGTVMFEMLVLHRALAAVRGLSGAEVVKPLQHQITQRVQRLMPWVLLILYGAGIGLAWHYRSVLENPLGSSLGKMLSLKMILAVSVLVHFLRAVSWIRSGSMTARRARIIHVSVFLHMLAIVVLAKGMFYIQ
jgi:hypothetical protein